MHLELTKDEWFMKVAIAEAYKGKGRTLPNPAVGAAVVKEGKIVSTGYHQGVGLPHAERIAIERAGREARGATLYVTLEPCNHYGRTPPCTEAIISAGIKRVVIGTRDPNPIASGGIERLREARIEVEVGILERECQELIEDFAFNLESSRPYLLLKLASSLDGKTADRKGDSKWITSPESRRLVHRLRSFHNAVMVGIGTVLKDNPLLTVRDYPTSFQPRAVVVDKDLKIPLNSRLVKERAKELIIITAQRSLLEYKAEILRDFGVRLVGVDWLENSLDLEQALTILKAEEKIYSLMCEGGATLAASLLKRNLVNRLYLFVSGKVLGDSPFPLFKGISYPIDSPLVFDGLETLYYGSDILIKGIPAR